MSGYLAAKMRQDAAKVAQRAATLSLAVTVVVVLLKLIAGVISGSVSVLAEALQSFVDVLISIGVVWTIQIAARPPDEDHPYGHGKAEVLMSAFQMILLIGTSGFVISRAVDRISHPQSIEPDIGLIAMGISALVNLGLSYYIEQVARKTSSTALGGETMHLRSDAAAAAGIFAGLIAVRLTNWQLLDPILAIAFTLIVTISALRKLKDLMHPLMDGAISDEDRLKIEAVLNEHPKVRSYHNVRTRTTGAERHVDLHVLLDDELTFVEAHDLAEDIEGDIKNALGGAWVNVHYEPYEAEMKHRREFHGEETRA